MDLVQPKREGYTFEGWSGTDIKEKDTQVTVTARPLKDRTYTANWKENSYTIVFNVEGEVTRGEMKNIPLRYTQETTIPENGYVCGGYKLSDGEPVERKVSKKYISRETKSADFVRPIMERSTCTRSGNRANIRLRLTIRPVINGRK